MPDVECRHLMITCQSATTRCRNTSPWLTPEQESAAMRATISSATKGDESPQNRELDLLGRWQASPTGRAAAAVHGLINEIDELRRLSANPAAFLAMDWEGEDLEL